MKQPKWWQYAGAIVIGLPFAAVGVLLCLTGLGIPIGLPLLYLSGLPLSKLCKRQIKWEQRDHEMPSDVEKPWE